MCLCLGHNLRKKKEKISCLSDCWFMGGEGKTERDYGKKSGFVLVVPGKLNRVAASYHSLDVCKLKLNIS